MTLHVRVARLITMHHVISVRQIQVKGFILYLFRLSIYGLSEVTKKGKRMMHVNRFVVLPKCLHLGKRIFTHNVRHAVRHIQQQQQQRSIRSDCRLLSYAKDLFLGQINKVKRCFVFYYMLYTPSPSLSFIYLFIFIILQSGVLSSKGKCEINNFIKKILK